MLIFPANYLRHDVVHICKALAQRPILDTFFFFFFSFYSAKLALNEALPRVHPREDTIMCCRSRNPSLNGKNMKFLLKLASESGSIYELSIKVQVARV